MFTPIILAAAVATAPLASPVPGDVNIYTDWYAACDNGGMCEAGSLQTSLNIEFTSYITVRRGAGPDGLIRVALRMQSGNGEEIAILIDGREVTRGRLDTDSVLVIEQEKSLEIARALVRGRTVTLLNKSAAPTDNPKLGNISLTGSAAAMRFIDEAQDRNGTNAALTARGRRTDNSQRPLLPIVQQEPVTDFKKLPDVKQLETLAEIANCTEARQYGYVKDEAFPLARHDGKNMVLALIACGSGAYNFMSKAFIGARPVGDSDANWTFIPATFDRNPGRGFTEDGSPILVNAFFDEDGGVLGNYAKGRGLGDCGSSQSYVWDGASFRLIEEMSMPVCRGVWQWPTTWRANVETIQTQQPAN